MAKASETSEKYESRLLSNLQRVIDFVKFAETKNAALLALSSAWIIGCLNLEFGNKQLTPTWFTVISLVLLFVVIAALIAMISFLPMLHLPRFLGGKRAGPHAPNLLYFGDIAKQPALKELETALHARYFSGNGQPTDDYVHDLVVQIGVNSQIAVRKMRCFRIGVVLVLMAGFILLIPVIVMAFQGAKTLW